MADAEKPYRLYKGGRTMGTVPPAPRPARVARAERGPAKPPGTPRWGRRIGLGALVLAVLLVVWVVAGYLAVRKGVEQANERLSPAVAASLAAQDGLLVRTDPKRHRLAYLSIPRDLRVDIPGQGPNKINAAFQLGGAALTMKTVQALTGLQPNHVVMVDFDDFKEVIDALGGVEIDVPKPIVSNRFDCPYATDTRCQEWPGWRFGKGTQKMDGRRALVYSRIRENRLDLAENDLTRGQRQQAVLEAITDKLVSPRTFLKLPFVGDDLVKPLTTDLSAGQLLQLGWVRFRSNSGRALHCRLGGEPQSIGGESVLVGGEENSATLAMFVGRSAAQPPRPGTTFGAGCRVGRPVD